MVTSFAVGDFAAGAAVSSVEVESGVADGAMGVGSFETLSTVIGDAVSKTAFVVGGKDISCFALETDQ